MHQGACQGAWWLGWGTEINRQVDELIKKQGHRIKYITLSRSVWTATGRLSTVAGQNIIPDITIVYKDDTVSFREIGSPGQLGSFLQGQLDAAQASLPEVYQRKDNRFTQFGDY